MAVHRQESDLIETLPSMHVVTEGGSCPSDKLRFSDDSQGHDALLHEQPSDDSARTLTGIDDRGREESEYQSHGLDIGVLTREIERLEGIARRQAELMSVLRNERSKATVQRSVDESTRAALHVSRLSATIWRTAVLLVLASTAATLASTMLTTFGVGSALGSLWTIGAFAVGALAGTAGSIYFRPR